MLDPELAHKDEGLMFDSGCDYIKDAASFLSYALASRRAKVGKSNTSFGPFESKREHIYIKSIYSDITTRSEVRALPPIPLLSISAKLTVSHTTSAVRILSYCNA